MSDIPIESQRAVVHLVRTWWGDSYGHNMAEAGDDDIVRDDFEDTLPRLVEAGFVYGPEAEKEARIDEASRCATHEAEAFAAGDRQGFDAGQAAALQSLRERVEGLPHGSSCALVVMNVGGCDCHLAAVLRLIDEALE
jgi:hypothetical protein